MHGSAFCPRPLRTGCRPDASVPRPARTGVPLGQRGQEERGHELGGPTEHRWPPPYPHAKLATAQIQARGERRSLRSPTRKQHTKRTPGLQPEAWRSPVSLATSRSGRAGGGAGPQRRQGKEARRKRGSPQRAERRKEPQVLLDKRHLSVQQENGAGSRQTPAPGSTLGVSGLGSVTSPTSCQARPAHVRTQADTRRHTRHRLCTRARLSGRAAHLSFTWFCAPAPPPLAPSVLAPPWPPPLHSASVRSSMTAVSLGSSRLNSLAKRMKWM